MSKKKKLPQSVRDQRRLHEAEKARGSLSYTISETPKTVATANVPAKNYNVGNDLKYSLPIKEIKSDMVKNGMYVVFTVVVLVLLKVGNVDLGVLIKALSLRQ
jgi:hypothetical protein